MPPATHRDHELSMTMSGPNVRATAMRCPVTGHAHTADKPHSKQDHRGSPGALGLQRFELDLDFDLDLDLDLAVVFVAPLRVDGAFA